MLRTKYSCRLGNSLALLISASLLLFFAFDKLNLLSFSNQDRTLKLSLSTKSTFHQPHVKRDQELLNRFGCLVNKGIKYFEEGVLYAAEGFGDPPPDFGPDPFGSNGWTTSEGQDELPEIWDEVFADIPPRAPNPDEYELLKLSQDKRFANAWHQDNMETHAAYNGFYIPFSNTILMTSTYSPRWHVRRRGSSIPEAQLEQHIPHLNTVADVVWETWKKTAAHHNPATLRFYAVTGIINDVASPLMDYLFHRDGTPLDEGWQDRLTFGLDTDEGKALFGTPTGVAVAWLLIHRHGVLGRRDPRN
ncbi:MAG: hypothetical protein Q9213_006412 [Squamulea squamosa]